MLVQPLDYPERPSGNPCLLYTSTTSVPPMSQVAGHLTEGKQPEAEDLHLRPDEIAPSLNREEVLSCAPDTDGVFFKVPKVIER